MFQFDFSVLEFLCTFITVSVLTWYFYYLYCFNYWKKRGVPTSAPIFPAGNILNSVLGRENLFVTISNYYKEFKSKGYRHGGLYFFNGPVYLPVDPEIVKSMLTKDFEYFVDRGFFSNEKKLPLSSNLFTNGGLEWKNLRHKMSPAFTSGKLKTMYEIFVKIVEDFIEVVQLRVEKDSEINIKDISTNYAADNIFSTAFGLEAETLKYPENNLSKIALNVFHVSGWNFLKSVVTEGFQNPGILIKGLFYNRKPEYFLGDILKNTIKQRDENNVKRNDFLNILLELRDKEGLSFNEIFSQCFLFFIAGFETSSHTISYCIHELAHNQELQDKLRKEIFDNMGSDFRKFSYENVFRLPYLEKVFNETLRLYPVLGYFNRMCVKPYKVPGTDVTIEEGTPVLLPIMGIQRDPDYFPDPFKFDPERFSEKNSLVPGTFLPFGEGPRFCIGMRYGKLQAMLGIAALISQFKFFPSQKTPKHIEFDKLATSISMVPTVGITVKAVKL